MTTTGKNRIMIYGPKNDGTYVVVTAAAEALAISIPTGETAVLKYFQERMPYGLFVPKFRETSREFHLAIACPGRVFSAIVCHPRKHLTHG